MRKLLAKQAQERIHKRISQLVDKCYMVYWDGDMSKDHTTFSAMLMHIDDEIESDIIKLFELLEI